MDDLKLPEQLKGRWEHALILTYGFDAPFFENALWSQFAARCRNKIILVDGQRYLEACNNYAKSGLVRYLNNRYIAGGIFCRQAAHAKLLLLTNGDQGRLLVGSGNLNVQGYASGGELFTRHEYGPEATETLPAFLAVRELIEGLVEREYVQGTAVRYIKRLLDKTPWLYQAAETTWRPVRHNLNQSFLDQLTGAVGDEPVEELWVLSPFYDETTTALAQLLARLNPRQATLLVQPGYTSVAPDALQASLSRANGRWQVRAISKIVDDKGTVPYLHAKMYLLKLPGRAICLHGSPNLSQVAMLLTAPQGNIELANLLAGDRDSFDYVLDALNIEPETLRLDSLNLSYQGVADNHRPPSDTWQLTGGEWQNDRLLLTYRGQLPDLVGATLIIAGRVFLLGLLQQQPDRLTIKLDPEAAGLLSRTVPVSLRWRHEGDDVESNPVFVCNRASLDAAVASTDEDETLDHIGPLDLEDEELEQLLGELEQALILDHRDVWQVAGKPTDVSPPDSDEDDAPPLDYDTIDYDLLCRHPRIRQYIERRGGSTLYARSRLQIILSSITNHFRGLLEATEAGKTLETISAVLEESEAQTEEEREQEETEKRQRRQSSGQRVRRILKGFIRRYLRGIGSARFQEFAGHEVMAQNYVIFSHLLWKLFPREWVEEAYIIESLLQMWQVFWGAVGRPGYYQGLHSDAQADVLEIMCEYNGEARLLAALFYSGRLAQGTLRLALRDFWRFFVIETPFVFNEETVSASWRIVADLIVYEPPRPTTIANELYTLADFQTENSFLRSLETTYCFPPGSCSFDPKVKVRRTKGGRVSESLVKCLVVRQPNTQPTAKDAKALLREWMRYEELDYYRISFNLPDSKLQVLYFDVPGKAGLYWDEVTNSEEPFTAVEPITRPWDAALLELTGLARQANERLRVPKVGVRHIQAA